MAFSNDPPIVPLKWPDGIHPNGQELQAAFSTTAFTSPFSRSSQTQELPGGRFMLSATFPPLREELTRRWRAFFGKLHGAAGRFFFRAEITDRPIPDLGAAEPFRLKPLTADSERFTADRTDITIDRTVTVAERRASAIAGSTASTIRASTSEGVGSLFLEAGRHVSFDRDGWRYLGLVVDDVIVQAGGVLQIRVEPPLRALPAAGAPLHIQCPTGIFALTDDDQGRLSVGLGRFASPSFTAVEAHDPRFTI